MLNKKNEDRKNEKSTWQPAKYNFLFLEHDSNTSIITAASF